jgi:hypothetical protein
MLQSVDRHGVSEHGVSEARLSLLASNTLLSLEPFPF